MGGDVDNLYKKQDASIAVFGYKHDYKISINEFDVGI